MDNSKLCDKNLDCRGGYDEDSAQCCEYADPSDPVLKLLMLLK